DHGSCAHFEKEHTMFIRKEEEADSRSFHPIFAGISLGFLIFGIAFAYDFVSPQKGGEEKRAVERIDYSRYDVLFLPQKAEAPDTLTEPEGEEELLLGETKVIRASRPPLSLEARKVNPSRPTEICNGATC
ncbi:MAG: hypothetical protein D6812_13005, partial [Deltaproteobacteria bacterium]